MGMIHAHQKIRSEGAEFMNKSKPIIALMYDFDKTLCTKDMQEYTFIPNIGMKAKEFWKESNALAKEKKMDT